MRQTLSTHIAEGHVIGIDIGGTNLRLALADSHGAILHRWHSTIADHHAPQAMVKLIRSGTEALLQQAALPWSALKAVAAGAPGITNVDTGMVMVTSYLLGWRDVPLRDLLQASLGVPAAIDNDVNLAALGESRVGAGREAPDLVFLAIGTGLGAGIVIDRKLLRGRRWSAGEIGYMLVPGAPDQPIERGKPGALESIIGGEGIRAQWQERWNSADTSLPQDASATQIFEAGSHSDPLAQTILEQTARLLSHTICNLYLILDCPFFVLGGGVGMHLALIEATGHQLKPWSPRVSVQLKRSELGTEAQIIGAICLAIDLLKPERL